MTEDKGILIKNIYYMLTYAFQSLRQKHYEEIQGEEFDRVQDLFAEILARGIAHLLKGGLYREYVGQNEDLPVMRGKLDIPGSIRLRLAQKQQLACEYDELSENNLLNQVLKTTALLLIREKTVDAKRRKALKNALLFFENVDELDPTAIPWGSIRYQRSSREYRMLINVCYFVVKGLLQTTEKGERRMASFSDEQMAALYEKFILGYYRHHHPDLHPASSTVKWDLAPETPEADVRFLPMMKTDITLKKGEKTLIIDAKYYARTMQTHFEKQSFHSGNLYQIFTYVKNEDQTGTGNVSGVLLYAKTGEAIIPGSRYLIGGNWIAVRTLDLNVDFKLIEKQLDGLVREAFDE